LRAAEIFTSCRKFDRKLLRRAKIAPGASFNGCGEFFPGNTFNFINTFCAEHEKQIYRLLYQISQKKNNIFNSTFESGELPTFIPTLANNGPNLGRDRTAAPAATTRVDRFRREITSCHAVR
jgi:hypothetical protein